MDPEKDYAKVNKALWNKKTAFHLPSAFYDNQRFIDGRSSLNTIELDLLGDVKGKRILHLQCHFGQDTISLATLGATRVVGLDFSPEAIRQAEKLNTACGTQVSFIESDVLQTLPHLENTFDVVFASYGVVGWHPSAKAWMDAAFHYLKPGGSLVLVDFHPVLWILDEEFKEIKYPYFNTGVIIENSAGSYAAPEADTMVNYTWNHSISDLILPIVDHPERSLTFFGESDWSPYALFEHTEKAPGQFQIKGKEGFFPLVYAIRARKETR